MRQLVLKSTFYRTDPNAINSGVKVPINTISLLRGAPVVFEVTMSDVEDAYQDLGLPVTSRRFMVSVSAHIMIIKGFRRLSAAQQKKLELTIRSLITTFLNRVTSSF